MNQNNILDIKERELALEPSRSFIVQAPAGSGKTELLTQRFLKLLGCIKKNPEEILAITFTRKAASEMRHRIIEALEKAAHTTVPQEYHAKRTYELAKLALENDTKNQWHLLKNPNRLSIQTIDSFCHLLTKQMPLLSRFGAHPTISENPLELYEKAASNAIALLNSQNTRWSKTIRLCLEHLDNRVPQLKQLLIEMLSKREQWLPHISQQHIREELEKGLVNITQDAIHLIQNNLPSTEILDALFQLADFAYQHTGKNVYSDIKEPWLSLADLLLTKENTLRKQINKNQGFPSKETGKDKNEKALFDQNKKQFQSLIQLLSEYPEFISGLIALRNSPPLHYSDPQWEILKAFSELLKLATAQLKIVFQEASSVDYSEIAQAASVALGNNQDTTDLALVLDYKINHLLIDEFQDTSNSQFRLFEQLTAEWQSDNQKTLFIVGDPMQSIYRFRDAEVGLFLRAKTMGISNIKLTPLTLITNFRSNEHVVRWINDTFSTIFPYQEDIASGAVSYNAFIASQQSSSDENVAMTIHPFINADKTIEAQTIVETIKNIKQKNPNKKIAILVKARRHATEILKTLRQHRIHYQAIDIDSLSNRPVIQDLFTLTKALLQPADRIAWLSLLRAPWCGLLLKDLHAISNFDTQNTILSSLNNHLCLSQLSEDGKKRITKIINVLNNSLSTHHQTSLRQWIYDTWIALDGLSCIENQTDLEDIHAYLSLIQQFENGGDILDFAKLEAGLSSLFATPDLNADDSLQIMTIHKAKGLEFDIVILPGLEKTSGLPETPLVRWMERPRQQQGSDLILSTIKAAHETENPIYQYLAYEETLKENLEDIRLLYVAVTRAKEQLHLLSNVKLDENKGTVKEPPTGSFLKLLWPIFQEKLIDMDKTNTIHSNNIKSIQKNRINRLPIDFF